MRRSRKEAIGVSKKREIVDDNDQDADEKCELCLPETETEGKEQGLVTQYPRKAVKKAPREEGTITTHQLNVVADTSTMPIERELIVVSNSLFFRMCGVYSRA